MCIRDSVRGRLLLLVYFKLGTRFVLIFVKQLSLFIKKFLEKLWFRGMIYPTIIKVWSTFSKVLGVGKAHRYFPFTQSDDSQTAVSYTHLDVYKRQIFTSTAVTKRATADLLPQKQWSLTKKQAYGA